MSPSSPNPPQMSVRAVVLAIVLAMLGVYGVMSWVVGQRTAEFGIRMALGARARDVVTMLLGQSLRPILTGRAKAVYGSRFLGEHKAMYFWHSVGNKSLTLLCNVLFDTTLTDMETCYKAFTIDIARQLRLREPGWGFDPEITARILRMVTRLCHRFGKSGDPAWSRYGETKTTRRGTL